MLLTGGKGGENYQDIMGVKHIYSDFSAVRGILKFKTQTRGGDDA